MRLLNGLFLTLIFLSPVAFADMDDWFSDSPQSKAQIGDSPEGSVSYWDTLLGPSSQNMENEVMPDVDVYSYSLSPGKQFEGNGVLPSLGTQFEELPLFNPFESSQAENRKDPFDADLFSSTEEQQ